MKRTSQKTDIALLKQQLDTIQGNELVHLKADIQELRDDVKGDIAELKQDIKDIKEQVSNLSIKLAYWSGGIAVIIIVVHYLIKI